jgi:predicted DNA-binding ribbon-helix-helix protein
VRPIAPARVIDNLPVRGGEDRPSIQSGGDAWGWRRIGRRRRLTGLVKRSFSLAGHRTSVALEEAFWDALISIATARGQTLSALVAATDAARTPGQPLASALRVLALREYAGS